MLAMQYTVRLPEEFDETQIRKHVAVRSPLFNGFPGLRHKFYLYDAEENVYAPFYIWENAQYAQEFLLDNLFNGVSQKFGRPRVRSWQVVAFDYGELKEDPGYMRSAIDKVPSNESVGMQMEKEKARHDKVLASPGLYMHMVLLDPDRWEVGHFSFWGKAEQAPPINADCIDEYAVLKSYRHLEGAA